MISLPPGLLMMAGALLLPILPATLRRIWAVALPALGMVNLTMLTVGQKAYLPFWGMDLTVLEVDRLSNVFGWIFHITAFTWAIYAWHLDDKKETTAAFLYAGSSLGVVYAGDLLTLFLNWEVMALTSAVVVLAGNTAKSRKAGLRYLFVHLMGGVLLLFGAMLYWRDTGSLAFGHMTLGTPATWLLLAGFAVNAAIPPFSSWLPDAYPESSATGTVFLSAYTTKTTVYVLATAFAGEAVLIGLGSLMAIYGIVYALNENDARRVLSYSIINQVGFMICGVGIGTELALNGVAAHAFCHILYKALLLMTAGAVMYRTGRTKCTDLGGLWKSMPITLGFAIVGAVSISSMPGTNGFISKSMITAAAATEHLMVPYTLLLVASAGVALHAGIKYPWFVFFNIDRGLRPKEAPTHMLIAMGMVAFLCIGLGVYYAPLYAMLPFPEVAATYEPYELGHVTELFQLLLASGVAFYYMLPFLKRTETLSLDVDWLYRKGGQGFLGLVAGPFMRGVGYLATFAHEMVPNLLSKISHNPPMAVRYGLKRVKLAFFALFGTDHAVDRAQEDVRRYGRRYQEAVPATLIPVDRTGIFLTVALVIYLSVYLIY